MKHFDLMFVVVALVGLAMMLFASDVIVKQIGVLITFCSFVFWCTFRVTGPYLEAKKRNGQE